MKKLLHILPQMLTILGMAFVTSSVAQNPGCDGSRYLNDQFSSVQKTTVVYAPTVGHTGLNFNLLMDVYEPSGDNLSARPVVILAHGGSFLFGDKNNMKASCELLAKKGYIAASIQYRLFPFIQLGFPDSLDIFDTAIKAMGDMKAAVRYFREDAATSNLFRADAANIFIGGYSAGAVIALHTAYLDEDDPLPSFLETFVTDNGGLEGLSGTASNKTYASASKAVVNLSGGLYRSFWIDGSESPLVSIHAPDDQTVRYTSGLAAGLAYLEGSSLVHAQAQAVSLSHNLFTPPGGGHTDLYELAQWKPYVDTFWTNATTLLESLACATVSTQEIFPIEHWALYPNPTTADFVVQLPLEVQTVGVQLFDLMGKLVLQQSNVVNEQRFRTHNLPKGTYVVRILHPNKRFKLKYLTIE